MCDYRYQLPFRCPVSQTTSVHSIDKLPNPDPMIEPLPLSMLKVTWNVAMHDGIDGVIKYLENDLGDGAQNNER